MSGITWRDALTDAQCEALQDTARVVRVAGDSEYGGAAYVYELAADLCTDGVVVPAGVYVRTVQGGHVQAWSVSGDVGEYMGGIDALCAVAMASDDGDC